MKIDSTDYKVEEIHQKGIWHLVRLVPKNCDDPFVRFGVIKGNELKMIGTKAEAKKFYGKRYDV